MKLLNEDVRHFKFFGSFENKNGNDQLFLIEWLLQYYGLASGL